MLKLYHSEKITLRETFIASPSRGAFFMEAQGRVRISRGVMALKRTEPLKTVQEINILLRLLKDWNQNYYMFALIAINWGLRCSDILGLTVGDVIAGTGKRVQITDRIVVMERKTKHERHIEINDQMKDALYEHIKKREKKSGRLDLSAPLILSQKRGDDKGPKAPSRQHASAIINVAAKKAGIRGHIGTHGLRKTFVYQAWEQNISVDVLQKILGHSSVAITHRYACIPLEYEIEAYKKVSFGVSPMRKRVKKRNGI
jgi:integrase